MINKNIFFTFFLLALYSNSQISLSGYVLDFNTNEPIISANIVIVNNNQIIKGTTSDLNGFFNVELNEGLYDIEISFIGYDNLKIESVNLNSNILLGNLLLSESSLMLSDIKIVSNKVLTTETALISLKTKSINSIDAISTQSISRTGDSNIASAIKRVSGVSIQDGKYVFVRGLGDRYIKTILNGLDIPALDPDKNTVQLDIFPASVIDNIVVYKTFTSNLPADFSGGLVDISLKSIPEKKIFQFSISSGFNSATFNNDFLSIPYGSLDFFGFDDGTRSIPLDNPFASENFHYSPSTLNLVDPASFEGLMDLTRAFNPEMGVTKITPKPNFSLSFLLGDNKKINTNKIGYYTAFNYKNNVNYYKNYWQNSLEENPDASIYELDLTREQYGNIGKRNILLSSLSGLTYNVNSNIYRLNILALRNTIQNAGLFYQRNIESNANYLKKENIEYSEKSVFNIFINGIHNKIDRLKIKWSISPTYSIIKDKDVRETAYEMIDLDDIISLDEIQSSNYNYLIDASNAGVPSRMWRDLDEYNLVSKLDISLKNNFLGLSGDLLSGVLFSYKQRDYQILRYLLTPEGLGMASGFTGDPNELLTDFIHDGSSGFYIKGEYQPSNTYSALQTNMAAYVSQKIQFNQLFQGIFGLRLEKYDQYYSGQSQNANINTGFGVYDNDKVLSDLGFFPSITFIYKLDEKTNLRSSYSFTTARPSFKEKSGAQILDVLSGITFNGNLDLEITDIHNVDLRFDRFYEKNQMIGISGFYKYMINPIEITRYSSDDDNIQPINTPSAMVCGFELEVRKSIDFISDNLFINSNSSIIYSKVDIVGDEHQSIFNSLREDEEFSSNRSMQGQAPYIFNCGVSYLNNKIESSLTYNVEGQKLSIVGINRRPNIYTTTFHSLNISISLNNIIYNNLNISLICKNILNQKHELVAQSFGIEDQIYKTYEIGRSVGLKLKYNIY